MPPKPILWRLLLPIAAVLCLLAPTAAKADITLPGVLGHRMVLQQKKPLKIWGWAAPGEKVEVRFAGQVARGVANKKGEWQVQLKPVMPGKPRKMVFKGNNRLVLQDILVGEVWLCSGQSNMLWPLGNSQHAKAALQALQTPNKQLRLFRVARQVPRRPTRKLRGQWQHATVSTARWFSAICYYFGAQLQRKHKVPVGLIQSAWGGTRIAAWMPWKTLASTPAFSMIIAKHMKWEKVMRPIYLKMRAYRMKRWRQQVAVAKAKKKPLPRRPKYRKIRPAWSANSPSALFNGMIYPLHLFKIRGVLWYQGENDVAIAGLYEKLFPVMIEQWRWLWGEQFPFLYVQLAPFRYRWLPTSAYNELCDAQRRTLKTTNLTGMAVTNDLGNPRDIHPRQKREVARRLFRLAQVKAYGKKKVIASGPLYRSMKRQGKKLLLSFDHVGGGLVSKGGKLTQFRIAGKDKRFYPAQAFIVGDHVMVWSKKVTAPVAVRFAWSDTAVHRLYNAQGLPASSFRTDRWQLTKKRRR